MSVVCAGPPLESLAFLSILIIFAQSVAGLSHQEQNTSVHEQVTGGPEESVPDTSSPNLKYVCGIEHVPSAGRSLGGTSDDGDERETKPMEITPGIERTDQADGSRSTQWMIQVSPGNLAWWLRFIDPRIGYPTTQEPQGDEIGWWIAQTILSVPIPALLVYEIDKL